MFGEFLSIILKSIKLDKTLYSDSKNFGEASVHLPEKYSDTPGKPVDAVIVDIPFKESFNANTREVSKG